MKDSPSAPPAPDYVGAAEATNTSQRVNQYTPYGNLIYTPGEPGHPATQGVPIYEDVPQTGEGAVPGATTRQIVGYTQGTNATPAGPWSSTVSLTPQAQHALDTQLGLSSSLGDLSQSYLPNVQQQLSKPMDLSSVQDISDAAYKAQTSRLDPQWAQQEEMQRAQLANQGLAPGGEAYDNAMRVFEQSKNDAYTQARLAADQQMPQTYQLASATYNQPLNTLNALRSGAQINNPQFSPNGAGANILGATQAQGQYQQGLYGSQVASTNAQNQQAAQVAAMMAMMMM